MNYDPATIEYEAEMLLCKTYPFYPWYVEVNRHFGEMEITNCAISNDKGMIINLYKRRTASELTDLIKHYGGELLERANLPRHWTEENLAMFLANALREYDSGQSLIQLDKSK